MISEKFNFVINCKTINFIVFRIVVSQAKMSIINKLNKLQKNEN